MNRRAIAVAVVQRGDEFLVGRRPHDAPLPHLAEFPGGKVHDGESPAQAARRECREETGLDVEVLAEIETVDYSYQHGDLRLHFFACRVQTAEPPRPPFRWVTRGELATLEFPPANRALLASLGHESL